MIIIKGLIPKSYKNNLALIPQHAINLHSAKKKANKKFDKQGFLDLLFTQMPLLGIHIAFYVKIINFCSSFITWPIY